MMGPRQQRAPKLFYVGVNLEDRVPADHLLRRLAANVDFAFLRPAVADCYGDNGQVSVDPIVLMKLMLLLFLENVRSERELVRQLAYRLDWLWFCELDLDSEVPDHSVLSKARRRWGLEVFEQLFGQVLERCVAAGLVDGRILHVDASCVAANADRQVLRPRLALAARGLYEQLEAAEGPTAPAPEVQPAAGRLMSRTDPEAGVTRTRGQTLCGYKDHRAVDDAHGIITATVTTDAATNEGHVLGAVLAAHEANTGELPETVVADQQYGSAENYGRLRQAGIKPCMPRAQAGPTPGKFPVARFSYDAATDCFVCPAGQWLRPYHRNVAERRVRYQASAGVCLACGLRAQCTDSKQGRRVERHLDQDEIDRAERCLSRAERRWLMRRRKIRAEGSFADAANWHGYKRARWRGLWRMRLQNVMIATLQNLRKLLHARRPRSRGAVLAGVSCPRLRLFWASLEPFEDKRRTIGLLAHAAQ